jgi:hypothetical protein
MRELQDVTTKSYQKLTTVKTTYNIFIKRGRSRRFCSLLDILGVGYTIYTFSSQKLLRGAERIETRGLKRSREPRAESREPRAERRCTHECFTMSCPEVRSIRTTGQDTVNMTYPVVVL